MSKAPNILFLLSDEHNAKCLGHVPGSQVKTPNLDGLAAGGVRCTNAMTQSPICTPSRISFASGQYPHNHGYYGLAGKLEGGPDLVGNLPQLWRHFRKAGYRTGAVGKSHLPPGWIEGDCDRFVEDKDPEEGYPAFLRERGIDPAESAALDWGRRVKASDPPRFGHDFGPDALGYEHSVEHWEAMEAMRFLEAHQDEPFFLQVGFWRPHTPCTPSPEFWDLYPEEELELPPNADSAFSRQVGPLRDKRAELENLPEDRFAFEPRSYEAMRRRYLRGYYGCISQMDHAVGEAIFEVLRDGGPTRRRVAVTENPWSRAVFDGRYRLVHAPDDLTEDGVLTDLQADPCEMENHDDAPEWRETRERLRRELLDRLLTRGRVVTAHPSLTREGKPFGKGHPGGRAHHVDADGRRSGDYVAAIREQTDRYV